MHERRFALRPVIELVGADFVLGGETLGALEQRVLDQQLEEISASW
jgi:hypothetical protein